ncbi:MAG: hypothetical protein R3B54_19020 [Bdellovibrionota bacterium]
MYAELFDDSAQATRTSRNFHHDTATPRPSKLINWQAKRDGNFAPLQELAAHRFAPGTTIKIVLFGSALLSTRRQSADYILTPYDRSPMGTTLLEGAAQTLGTLLEDNAINKSPLWFNWLLLPLVIGILTVNASCCSSPQYAAFFR